MIENQKLVLDSGYNTSSHHSVAVSNDSTSNPFKKPYTITLNNISIESSSTTGSSFGYIVVGREEHDTGNPITYTSAKNYLGTTNATYDEGGGAIALNITKNNATGSYSIIIYDLDTSAASTTYHLSGAPTDLVWTIDNTTSTYINSFKVTGATITSISGNGTGVGTDTGSVTWNEAYARFTPDDIEQDGQTVIRTVIGVINAGNLDDLSTSQFKVGKIHTIPEASVTALIFPTTLASFALIRRR